MGFSSRPNGTLLSAAIRAFASHCDLVLVVVGRNADALRSIIYAESGSLVCNPEPERGQFSSLQIGLQEVLNHGRDMAMITLVDRPPASRETLHALVRAFFRRQHGTWAIVPEYEGKHGHPIVIGREMIDAFLKAPAASNAREIEHANVQRITYLPTSDPAIAADFNTPEDYSPIQSPR